MSKTKSEFNEDLEQVELKLKGILDRFDNDSIKLKTWANESRELVLKFVHRWENTKFSKNEEFKKMNRFGWDLGYY